MFLETQFFEMKGNLSSEKKLWAIFPRIIGYYKPSKTLWKGLKGFLTISEEVIRPFV